MKLSSLSNQQKEAVYGVEDGSNIFISGSAGTGKSYLLQYLKANYLDHGLHITASTGIAAVNVGGQTIHSWAAIGLGKLPKQQIISNLFSLKLSGVRRRIKMARILAIDEISMISAATFDLLNDVFKAVRQNQMPFGGLQIILFGDFLQLPPVLDEDNSSEDYRFCFQSDAWKELDLRIINLTKPFRQQDAKFVALLDNIRYGKINQSDADFLKSRMMAHDDQMAIKPTILASHNYQVDNINQRHLEQIPKDQHNFAAKFSGDSTKIDFLRKNCLAAESLSLKVGAQVMMLKNTYQNEGVVNGSLGVVKRFSRQKNYPIVEFANGTILTIGPEEWPLEKFDKAKNKVISLAKMKQIPLALAWAMTIHKSQGMTLDKIRCNLGRVFTSGQIYVALSRVKTAEGLFIEDIDLSQVRADPTIVNFYQNLLT